MLVLGLALAALIGLSLGLLGGGGSILTVPIFVYVLGFEPKPAIAMSLPVVGLTSLVGAVRHWRDGNVAVRVALAFGAVAMLGSYAGAHASRWVSGRAQLALLAIVMLVAAALMFRRAAPVRESRAAGEPDSSTAAGDVPHAVVPVTLTGAAALGVGVVTGLAGIGGGFMIVPALVLLANVPMKRAIGTSLLVIAMSTAAALWRYAVSVPIDWSFVAMFTLVAIIGILGGTRLVRYVSAAALRRGFAVFLLAMGVLILYENRSVLRGGAPRGAR